MSVKGDNFETSRVEYCNIKVPSLVFLSNVIKYCLYVNQMNMEKSFDSIMNSEYFLCMIKWTLPSCFTIADIINKACYFAKLSKSNVCKEEHILKSLHILKFNFKLYKELQPYKSMDEQEQINEIFSISEKSSSESSKCTIS